MTPAPCVHANLSKDDFDSQWTDFFSVVAGKAKTEEVVAFFYYSGHGMIK